MSSGHIFTSISLERKQQACEITNGDRVNAFVLFSFFDSLISFYQTVVNSMPLEATPLPCFVVFCNEQ